MFTVHKTTLGEQNRGVCGSPNNCRYKGSTVCWRLDWKGENFGALARKKDAELVAALFAEHNPQWNGVGDYLAYARSYANDAEFDQLYDAKEV